MDRLLWIWIGLWISVFFGERILYQIEISFKDEDFLGRSKEEKSKSSVGSTGKINGYIENDLITFMKTYPIKYTIRNDDVIEIPKG